MIGTETYVIIHLLGYNLETFVFCLPDCQRTFILLTLLEDGKNVHCWIVELFRLLLKLLIVMYFTLKNTKGWFHKSWAQGVKRRVHPILRENVISWAQSANDWCQIRVNLCKEDGCRAQISSVGHKLPY
jgi:hypothetical protein